MQRLLCKAWPPIRLRAGTHNMDRRLAASGGKHRTDVGAAHNPTKPPRHGHSRQRASSMCCRTGMLSHCDDMSRRSAIVPAGIEPATYGS